MSGTPASEPPPGGRVVRWFDATIDLGMRPILSARQTTRRLLAFGLIVLATVITKFGRARAVVHPLIWGQIRRAGVRLLPFVGLLSMVSGFVVIGQTMAILRQVGAQNMLGPVIVVALFREIGPLAAAFLVLLRVGTATVVELATMRATGEVEALEALSIDPVHFLVMPRVIGLSAAVFCLTVYYLIGALLSGYLFLFLRQEPITPVEYLDAIAKALTWEDFVLLFCKTAGNGAAIAVITCYQGLSRPLRLDQVADATTRAVTQSVVFCVLTDLLFLAIYQVLL